MTKREEIVLLNLKGLSKQAIATKVGCTRKAVTDNLREAESVTLKRRIILLREQGHGVHETARLVGCTPSYVSTFSPFIELKDGARARLDSYLARRQREGAERESRRAMMMRGLLQV